MSARTILKHLHQQGRMTDYQFDVINRNLKERPQGEWEFFSIGNNQYSRCSVCKDKYTSEYTDLDWWYENFKYCPNCGARMGAENANQTNKSQL